MNGQKALKQIALIKTGSTIDQIKPKHGDFEDWFAQGLGVSDLLQIDVFNQQASTRTRKPGRYRDHRFSGHGFGKAGLE